MWSRIAVLLILYESDACSSVLIYCCRGYRRMPLKDLLGKPFLAIIKSCKILPVELLSCCWMTGFLLLWSCCPVSLLGTWHSVQVPPWNFPLLLLHHGDRNYTLFKFNYHVLYRLRLKLFYLFICQKTCKKIYNASVLAQIIAFDNIHELQKHPPRG